MCNGSKKGRCLISSPYSHIFCLHATMLRGKQLSYGKVEDVRSMQLASTLYRLVRTLSTPVQEISAKQKFNVIVCESH